MAGDNPNRRQVTVAVVAAGFVMLIFGLTYRVVEARLSAPVSSTPIDPDALEPLPMQIGDWTGQDVPLDEAETLMPKIRAEAYINRAYSRGLGPGSVSLFIAASGTTGGTLTGHPPEICNVGSGYTPGDHHSMELSLGDGIRLPCRILEFSRGSLSNVERKTVLYYYMADEHFCGNRSALRYKVRRGANIVRCVAQVQIASSSKETLTADMASRLASDFAVDSAPAIVELLKDIGNDQGADTYRQSQQSE